MLTEQISRCNTQRRNKSKPSYMASSVALQFTDCAFISFISVRIYDVCFKMRCAMAVSPNYQRARGPYFVLANTAYQMLSIPSVLFCCVGGERFRSMGWGLLSICVVWVHASPIAFPFLSSFFNSLYRKPDQLSRNR